MPRTGPRADGALPAARAVELRDALLPWYGRTQRPLPWRATSDPYAIWISEAMLQQTRVETVVDYWLRFLERFPTVYALAEAAEEELLAAWSGLGYYRRARSLQAAARIIAEQLAGRFPRERSAALALPGVGPYTAGAVLSIAYDLPEPVVDGNVARVFARLFGLEDELGSRALEQRAWSLAAQLVPRETVRERGPGAWNQALMELGATVCTPRHPRCEECPLDFACSALRTERQAELPRPKPKRGALDVRLEILMVRARGRLLLTRRPPGGRMAGMWECPTREVAGPRGALSGLYPSEFVPGTSTASGEPILGTLAHGITHHRIRAEIVKGSLHGRARAPLRWFEEAELPGTALTGMARKVLRLLAG